MLELFSVSLKLYPRALKILLAGSALTSQRRLSRYENMVLEDAVCKYGGSWTLVSTVEMTEVIST